MGLDVESLGGEVAHPGRQRQDPPLGGLLWGAGAIVHRVVKDLLVQTGDPTGTGRGGESVYGKPFKTEVPTAPIIHFVANV